MVKNFYDITNIGSSNGLVQVNAIRQQIVIWTNGDHILGCHIVLPNFKLILTDFLCHNGMTT